MTIRWSVGAKQELLELVNYIGADDVRAARKMAQKIKATVSKLRQLPHRGRVVPEFEDPSIHELIVAPYRVLYLVEHSTVFILCIRHGRRILAPDILKQSQYKQF